MRPGNLQSGIEQLNDATQKLLLAWADTKDYWKDSRAADFEADVIEPLQEAVEAIRPVINQTAALMATANRQLNEE